MNNNKPLFQPDLKPCKGDAWKPPSPMGTKDLPTCVNCQLLHNGFDWRSGGICLGIEGWHWIKLLMETLGDNRIE